MTVADCLVLVDLQRAFVLGDEAVPGAPALMSAVRELVDSARAAGARSCTY